MQRTHEMKGFASIIIAAAAITLLVFALNTSANTATHSSETLFKMQAARENAIKMDNAMRIIDKAFAQDYFNYLSTRNCNNSNAPSNSFQQIHLIQVSNALTSIDGGTTCDFYPGRPDPFPSGSSESVVGRIRCKTTVAGTTVETNKRFYFLKEAVKINPGNICTVKDVPSGCQELPNFNCP